MSKTLYIVDADREYARCLAALLDPRDIEVESYSTAEEFQQHFEPSRAAGVIIDVDLAGLGGLQLLRQLRDSCAKLPLVLMAAYGSAHLSLEALRAGACDVMQKPFDARVIRGMVDAIRSALADSGLDRAPSAVGAGNLDEELRKRFGRLTEREQEIARLVSSGQSSKAIAARLHLSRRTVDNHRAHILEKLELENFVQVSRSLMLLQQAS